LPGTVYLASFRRSYPAFGAPNDKIRAGRERLRAPSG